MQPAATRLDHDLDYDLDHDPDYDHDQQDECKHTGDNDDFAQQTAPLTILQARRGRHATRPSPLYTDPRQAYRSCGPGAPD